MRISNVYDNNFYDYKFQEIWCVYKKNILIFKDTAFKPINYGKFYISKDAGSNLVLLSMNVIYIGYDILWV